MGIERELDGANGVDLDEEPRPPVHAEAVLCALLSRYYYRGEGRGGEGMGGEGMGGEGTGGEGTGGEGWSRIAWG